MLLRRSHLAPDKPLLVDEYLGHAIELDVELLVGTMYDWSDNGAPTGGGHSLWRFDLLYPHTKYSKRDVRKGSRANKENRLRTKIKGCFNIQFAIQRQFVLFRGKST